MAGASTRILLVEDNLGDAKLVELAIGQEAPGRYVLERVDRIAEAEARLQTASFDAVLLDMNLPDGSGLEAFRAIRAADPGAAIIVLSGMEDPELVAATMGAGAQGFRVKGTFPHGFLGRTIEAAIARQRLTDAWGTDPERVSAALAQLDRLGEAAALVAPGIGPRTTTAFDRALHARPHPSESATPWSTAAIEAVPVGRRFGAGRLDGDALPFEVRALGPEPGAAWLVTLTAPPVPVTGSPSPADGDPLDATAWSDVLGLADGSPGFLAELVEAFLRESSDREAELIAAADRGDGRTVADAAHALKSSCAQVAAVHLSRQFAAIEVAARAGDLAAVRDTIAATRGARDAVVRALQRRVGTER